MSTIKNNQISLHCHLNKIIKGPGVVSVSRIEPKACWKYLSYGTLVFDQVSFLIGLRIQKK